MSDETRYCNRCDRTLPLTQFHKDKKRENGHAFYCKDCMAQYGRKYRLSARGVYTSAKNLNKFFHRKPMKIPMDIFVKWYDSQEQVCHYCGISVEDIHNVDDTHNNKNIRLTLDCMDNYLGYVEGNLVLSCHRCNSIKNDFFTYDEMRFVARVLVHPRWEKQLGKKINIPILHV